MVQFISEIPWKGILECEQLRLVLSMLAGLGMGHIINRLKAFPYRSCPRMNLR